MYSGRKDQLHLQEVTLIIMDKKAKSSLMEWEHVNFRILRTRLNSKYAKLTIISCYSPTNAAEEEDKDEFFAQLNDTISKVSGDDTLIILGDLNAKIGSDNSGY